MNCKINIDGGGIFSKFMLGLQNTVEEYKKHSVDSIYFNIIDNRTNQNMFDYVLEQSYDESYTEINCENIPSYNKKKPIEGCEDVSILLEILSKLKIKNEVLDKVNYYKEKFNINDETIGLHVRLTDMNIHHLNDYGFLSFDDFNSLIEKDKKYFVSSDNNESLLKLKELHGENICFIEDFIRCESETEDSTVLQLNYFRDERLWVETFVEMLLLANCGSIICRTSNLNNASIILSKTIKKITRL